MYIIHKELASVKNYLSIWC